MKKIINHITILLLFFFYIGCSNNISSNDKLNSSWIFVANEGNACWEEYGDDCSKAGNGSISAINDAGDVFHYTNIGYTVNSLEVYQDKLYVIINQEHKVQIYNIKNDGLILEEEIHTNHSSPREMVILNNKLFFTNWLTNDVKILNLINNSIEDSILIDGVPEDIISDGMNIWVSIPEKQINDGNQGNKVAKIDPIEHSIIEYINVGKGPQDLLFHNNEIFISRTFWEFEIDDNGLWIPETIKQEYGSSKISSDITINSYASGGSPCGASIVSYANKVYRSYNGGIAPFDNDLNINAIEKIGKYDIPLDIYHVEIIEENIWFCLTDYNNINMVKKVDWYGNEIASFTVGINPGDIAYWISNK